ncbi:MAG: shikimate dehydrogenase [Crocinitomicaceae bacterium]
MSDQKIYGLIGKSLEHSFSKKYFLKKFDNMGFNCDYLNFELNDINEVKKVFDLPGISGVNVTIPYKEKIIPYLDELSDEAIAVGAVNTIQIKNGVKKGYNTDVYGFKQLIKPFFQSHHERSMILGTGGAAKAVAYVLESLGSEVIYISRKPKGENAFSYEEINENMIRFNGIIVNTTPLGTFPDVARFPPIPYHFIQSNQLVIDLVYNPPLTEFLKRAAAQGATVLNGKTMLEQQAEKSWEIWNA